ncbi:glycosyltransferase family 2 protein, partial [bacterium]|nr:glycosyltransferase family 2 protein [bacterium]
MMNLDVVIVNWNTGAQLRDCLQSLSDCQRSSSCRIARCVIVDNASTDGSDACLPGHPFPVEVVRNTVNMGFGHACNQGARLGSSDYILFVNPDVKLFPDNLDAGLEFIDKPQNRHVGILGIQLVDEQGVIQRNASRFPRLFSLLYAMFGLDRFLPSVFPPRIMLDWDHRQNAVVDQVMGALFLIRRSVFESLGGFDERFFLYFEDVDLALRARNLGWESYYLATTRAFHKGGGATQQAKARRLFHWLHSRVLYADKHFGRGGASIVFIASIAIEFPSRMVWNILNFSWEHLRDTIEA